MAKRSREQLRKDIIYFDILMIFWMIVLVLVFSSSYNLNLIQFILAGLLVLAILVGYNLGLLRGLVFSLFLVFGYGTYLLHGVLISGRIAELRVDLIGWLFILPVGAYLAGQLSQYVSLLFWQQEISLQKDDYITIEEITGFLNVRGFFRELEVEVERARRFNHDLCVLVMKIANIDEMRLVYGSKGVNSIIKAIAGQIDQVTRSVDKKGLIEMDTIALILPETPIEGARVVTEKLHHMLERIKVDFERGAKVIKLRLGIGIAEFVSRSDDAYVLYDRAREEASRDVG